MGTKYRFVWVRGSSYFPWGFQNRAPPKAQGFEVSTDRVIVSPNHRVVANPIAAAPGPEAVNRRR
ncbi:MAG TPA: hypothetical protein VK475_13630 [Pyrinomonadaceae bacterium]|nr:hypothetical protein [Pyrinomonadaceae bacterium]